MQQTAEQYRTIMLDRLGMANDEIAEMLMEEQTPSIEQIQDAMRKWVEWS